MRKVSMCSPGQSRMQGNQALTCAGPLGGGHTPGRLITEGRVRHSWLTWNHKGERLLWLERPREFSKLTPIGFPSSPYTPSRQSFLRFRRERQRTSITAKRHGRKRQRESMQTCGPGDTSRELARETITRREKQASRESRRRSHQPHMTTGCCYCAQG